MGTNILPISAPILFFGFIILIILLSCRPHKHSDLKESQISQNQNEKDSIPVHHNTIDTNEYKTSSAFDILKREYNRTDRARKLAQKWWQQNNNDSAICDQCAKSIKKGWNMQVKTDTR